LEIITLNDRIGQIRLENNSYTVKSVDKKIEINGSKYAINESFYLDDIKFDVVDVNESYITVAALFFSNEDVLNVLKAYSYVKYEPDFNYYQFIVPVEITDEASNRFAKITSGLEREFSGREFTLKANLMFLLDDEVISTLRIPMEIAGKKFNTPSISGFTTSERDANKIRISLLAVLESGTLPHSYIASVERVEPTRKTTTLVIPFIIIILFINTMTWLRYKNIMIGPSVIMLAILEITLVLGVFGLTQIMSIRGWIVNFSVIVGLFILMCLSLIQTLIITEILFRKERLKSARRTISNFNKIFTIVVFIISFMSLYIPQVRGIGMVNVVGVLFGSTLTKPLYINTIEKIKFRL